MLLLVLIDNTAADSVMFTTWPRGCKHVTTNNKHMMRLRYEITRILIFYNKENIGCYSKCPNDRRGPPKIVSTNSWHFCSYTSINTSLQHLLLILLITCLRVWGHSTPALVVCSRFWEKKKKKEHLNSGFHLKLFNLRHVKRNLSLRLLDSSFNSV